MSSNQSKEKLLLIGLCSRCGRVFRGSLVKNRFICEACFYISEPAQGTQLPSQFFFTFTTSNNAGDS